MKKLDQQNPEDTAFAIDLVAAFSRCVNYPRDPDGVRFLADGLSRAAFKTGASMSSIVERCLDESERCPTDHEFIKAGEAIKGPRDLVKVPLGCEKCQGSGWEHFTKTVSPSGVAPYEADYCRFCSCAAGQFLQAAELKRKREAAEKAAKRATR